MKSLILVLSVLALSMSSAFASNCKVVDVAGLPGVTKALTDHGYIVSQDADSQYAVMSSTDYDDNTSGIKTEIKLIMNNGGTEVAAGVGESHVPTVLILLNMCGDDEECLGRKEKRSQNRAIRSFKKNLEVCR